MIGENDWRLELGPMVGNADSIKNIALYRIPFNPLSDKLDHEHCIFRDAHWICPECYEDFKELFGWTLSD